MTITSGETGSNGCTTTLTQNIGVFVSGGIISGCNCCTLNTDSTVQGGVTNHTISSDQNNTTQSYYLFNVGLGNTFNEACTNYYNTPTPVLVNSNTLGVGVSVYSGSPSNPQLIIGYTYLGVGSAVYILNSGQITEVVSSPSGVPISC